MPPDPLPEPTPDQIDAGATQLAVEMMRLSGEHPAQVYTQEGYTIWLRSVTNHVLSAALSDPEVTDE